jgi:hypothetical protein
MTTKASKAEISKEFDPLFGSIGTGIIPVEFLRVLAFNESSLHPGDITIVKDGKRLDPQKLDQKTLETRGAHGLFQTMAEVLKDYNLLHGTKYKLTDVSDPKHPELGAKIGIELLERIVRAYNKNHPTLGMNWGDPRWVALVVQGFNAGYSEAGGVGHVVSALEKLGIPKERVTVDAVSEVAPKVKGSRFLSEPARVRYAKHVADQYMREIGSANRVKPSPTQMSVTFEDSIKKLQSGAQLSIEEQDLLARFNRESGQITGLKWGIAIGVLAGLSFAFVVWRRK